MTWYELFLFIHITAAVIWVGGGFVLQMYAMGVRRGGDPAELARFAGRAGVLGERMFVPASLVVILAGIAMMINGDWDWGQLWVIFGLLGFAYSFVNGLFLITPMAKKLPEIGPTTPAGQALIVRLFAVLRAELAVLFAIVFAMVVKPTTDEAWVVVVAGVILVAAIVVALAPLRSQAPAAGS